MSKEKWKCELGFIGKNERIKKVRKNTEEKSIDMYMGENEVWRINLKKENGIKRKKKKEEEEEIKKKQKIRKRIILFSGVILALIVGVIVYLNSYTGKVNKGYRMLENGKYKEALLCFEKAVSKNEKRGEAYEGLAKVYLAQNDTESGEKVFLNAIKEQPSNTEIYQKAIQFYIDTDQKMKVSVLLDQCTSEQVLSACSDYISEEPEYSLDEMKEYEEIQALELTGTGTAIYYTTDGTDPTQNSLKYTEPIRLDERHHPQLRHLNPRRGVRTLHRFDEHKSG